MARRSTATEAGTRVPELPPKGGKKLGSDRSLTDYYLLAYNTISGILWAYILVVTLVHLAGYTAYASVPPPSTASSAISKFASYIPFLNKQVPMVVQLQTRLPAALQPLYTRSMTLYSVIGPQTTWIQTLAVLEVAHAFLGLVRSSVQTTLMQVASRLFTVWVVLEHFEAARTNPLVATLLMAWTHTEVVRYAHYALNILGIEFYPILWLRYSMFYILYPMGAFSEAFLNYATLPSSSPTSKMRSWTPAAYARAVVFFIWWPSLWVLYSHMLKQRRKVLGGGGRKLKEN